MSGAQDATVRVWDFTLGTQLRKFTYHKSSVNHVLILSNNEVVVSCSDDCTVRFQNILTGELLLTLKS